MLTWLVLPLLGIVVGMLSGLLGIGGGIVLVPMLATILPVLSIETSVAIHLALGTSLACASLTLLSSSLAHKKNGNLDPAIFYSLLPGVIAGAILGPYIVSLLPTEILKYVISVLLFCLAVNMAFDYSIPSSRVLPSYYMLISSGLAIGLISSFAGLSGAVFIVPFLIWFGTPMRQAVGTAAMSGLPLSLVGMISYMIVGLHTQNLPVGAIGYVYWPAVIVISLTSMPTAQLAARLSVKIPKEILKRLLAIVLTFVAAKMLFF